MFEHEPEQFDTMGGERASITVSPILPYVSSYLPEYIDVEKVKGAVIRYPARLFSGPILSKVAADGGDGGRQKTCEKECSWSVAIPL
jgi:hypothetical protein